MIDENEGFTGGGSGFVYRTTDGGENWDFHGSIPSTLTDIDFGSDTQGYACGDNGAVFSITPQGVTNLNSGLAENLSGISVPSVDNVWVCGIGSIVYYNGSTFTFQSGPAGTYNSIFFINDNEGWVVGNSGLIGHTVNSGTTWTSQASSNPSDESLFDIFFLTTEIGWAVGARGTILKTTNGGDTWVVEGAGLTTALLRRIHFTSPTNGYVVGNGKTLLKYGELTGTGSSIVETLQFEIFPNPAQNEFKVQCSEFKVEEAEIEIYDLNGRKLLEKHIPAGTENIEVDVSHLKNGVYFCRLISENKSTTQKLIIQK